MALKDITRECGEHLAPMAPAILDLISNSLPVVCAGRKREGYRLMHTSGMLIKFLSNEDEQIRYLESTLGFCIMDLKQHLQVWIILGVFFSIYRNFYKVISCNIFHHIVTL